MSSLLLFPGTPEPPAEPQNDQHEREQALDTRGSYIVQAPAGAGKTELLTRRFLKLLGEVQEPEEILAITFTRAATAEMRNRILRAMEGAQQTPPTADEDETLRLARRALANSEGRGWHLLEQPHRLDVQTIDSLCLRLAHSQPLLSRLGGRLEPTEQAAGLYSQAAERTFSLLGTAPDELDQALRHLLLLRDNDLAGCQGLLASMLAGRERWARVFPLTGHADLDWTQVRRELGAPLRREVQGALTPLHTVLAAEPALVEELLHMCRYSCANRDSQTGVALLAELSVLPGPDPLLLGHWQCLRTFLLTNEGEWRREVTRREGFPTTEGTPSQVREMKAWKARMKSLLTSLQSLPAGEQLRSGLARLCQLPAPLYTEEQWTTLRSIFIALRRAIAELSVLFAERDQIDFPGLALAAAAVLDDTESVRGLLASESRLHLLVDEFQDTSRSQHELLGRLLREWQLGDGRTCFLVGDPMQSIYLFREAEVELFGRVQQRGLDCGNGRGHPCAPLTLRENFRSHAELVGSLNEFFAPVFLGDSDVPFSPSYAKRNREVPAQSVHLHPFFADARNQASKDAATRAQTECVLATVTQHLASGEPCTIGILGRAKHHLAPIAKALREQRIPFRAVELEKLTERQEILDLLSLLRALQHPADRIAWLSVLRAPWCGLRLRDLHQLTGADAKEFRSVTVRELARTRAHLLTEDGQARLARTLHLLEQARDPWPQAPAAWLEHTWTLLGAPSYLSEEERENCESFFRLYAQTAAEGSDLERALDQLCAAPDPHASEQTGVQLMTIHKAKGLAFDVVIVPALERGSNAASLPFISVVERTLEHDRSEVLAAPLGRKGAADPTYSWVRAQHSKRERAETKRLLYVACTRAREELHLLGTATENPGSANKSASISVAQPASLLACAWPSVRRQFEQAWAERNQQAVLPSLAAAAEKEERPRTLRLRRMESGAWTTAQPTPSTAAQSTVAPSDAPQRPSGSYEQRARGNAVHAMLEFLAGQPSHREQLEHVCRPVLRRAGLPAARIATLSRELLAVIDAVLAHPHGQWVLAPHPEAQSETRWQREDGTLLRVDRSFRAGPEPLAPGKGYRWIVDYKTGGRKLTDDAAMSEYLAEQRELYRPQLERYGELMRSYHGPALPLRYALYFPELLRLLWWEGV